MQAGTGAVTESYILIYPNGRVGHFHILIWAIHELRRSLDFLVSSSVSSITILKFIFQWSFMSLVRLIPRYFVFFKHRIISSANSINLIFFCLFFCLIAVTKNLRTILGRSGEWTPDLYADLFLLIYIY